MQGTSTSTSMSMSISTSSRRRLVRRTLVPIWIQLVLVTVTGAVVTVAPTTNTSNTGIPTTNITGTSTTATATAATSTTTISITIHQNGEAESCGSADLQLSKTDLLSTVHDKYQVEQLITQWLSQALVPQQSDFKLEDYCDMGPEKTPILWDHDHLRRVPQPNNNNNNRNPFLPCRWHTQNGQRITSFTQLFDLATAMTESPITTIRGIVDDHRQHTCDNNLPVDSHSTHQCRDATTTTATQSIHLVAVPAGRLFVFAPTYVGQVFRLSHLSTIPESPIDSSSSTTTTTTTTTTTSSPDDMTLTVLSLFPRVFEVQYLFTKQEASELITRALTETSPTHKLTRSSTGTTSRTFFSRRTSETAFDPQGAVAVRLKQRILRLLGILDDNLPSPEHHRGRHPPNNEWVGHDDGIQILRYNQTTAYAPHLDFLTDSSASPHNFDSSGVGGNRFATVLLYLSDVTLGGETVFTQTEASHTLDDALQTLRESGDTKAAGIQVGSWEEEMVANCRRHLAISPKQGRAVLFYNQHPNGQVDNTSLHGGCPILHGEKWAANLWVWNTPRRNHPGAPLKTEYHQATTKKATTNVPTTVSVTFRNSGMDPAVQIAELWYDEGRYWGPLGHDDPPLQFDTYQGHRWNIRVNGQVVHRFVIGPEEDQEFVI